MNTRNWIAFGLIIVSLICLYPGLTEPILQIKVGMKNVPILGTIEIHNVTQSIVQTIQELWQNDNRFVAFLILLFSIVVPVVKAILLLIALFGRTLSFRKKLHQFVALIGKWSMADVFVVGVLIAFLGTRSDDAIDAQLHVGFYYFLGYCLISIIAYQVLAIEEQVSE